MINVWEKISPCVKKLKWIKKNANVFNKLIGDARLEEAEELWADFTNKLEELKAGYMADYDIPKDKIRREETIGGKIQRRKRDAPEFRGCPIIP